MEDIEAQMTEKKEREAATILKKANSPVTLKFEDVVYKVEPTKKGLCQKGIIKKEEKVILKGITGFVLPGEMLAMLGPSGCGKTTLLTALGGKLIDGKLEGTITYNGKPFSNVMKRNSGFVTQHDILYPHLTVTETLVFTAFLRLPNSLTKEEKIMHAEAVITQLGLVKCKNTIIGGPFLRGVSGGERKRVSIGQELLVNPSLLFLDEPTSGLDSTTAQRIVSSVWELAKGGRTVVMTIHQPSRLASQSDAGNAQAKVKQTLVSAYKNNLANKLKAEIEAADNRHLQDGLTNKQYSEWPITWWQQFQILFRRGIKERKHKSFSGRRIVQVLVMSLLSGLLWWQSDTSHLQDQIGLLFFCTGFWGFIPLYQAIFTFPTERRMLAKERSSGTYRLSSYFISRMAGDLPMELLLPTIFVTITYWMAGLKPTPQNFLHTLFVLLFNVLLWQSLGLALGALIMNQKSATILGSIINLSFQLAGGYFIRQVPFFIAWIKYISISRYTYKLLLGSQYKPSETYPCGDGVCSIRNYPSIKIVGLDGQLLSAFALGIMFLGYRLIAYLALMRIGATRK
ncbi:hypothetical protein JCGZ_20955 [Jatropha curcas]|uniref:ABC transporter domain-containing protein n=1 Tax=Jatropha curcas TaxID=180498 RepID=A0A067K435_JATCU|nr:hypothetical protein JCGZ_20955 [Jatropha curcas]